jgi:asparagine synthase (glutamine-hydrolysing)
MCGIVGVFNLKPGEAHALRPQMLDMSKRIRHRGPDWSGIYSGERTILCHERLSIVDPESGGQPLYSPDRTMVLAVNGEIYNHQQFREELAGEYEFQTKSDCEVILPLYKKYGPAFIDKLDGIYAFALYDIEHDRYLIARDHIGIIPLYYGYDNEGRLYVASELKALEGYCSVIKCFPPGHYIYSPEGTEPRPWYKRDWMEYDNVKDNPTDINQLREALTRAVDRQLMADVPYGVLLSGGLDSSVISALAQILNKKKMEEGSHIAWSPRLHSFAVGLKGAPDLIAARKVAEHIGTIHHEINYTVQEGLDAVRDVIYYLETYDVTTVRASTPMYLLARVIKSMGIKMVLSGEGADEIFGGYLYFHKAPSPEEFHKETVRKLSKLYLYDCLRANKALSAWGVEGRVPFLDYEFLDVAMRLNPKDKMSGPLGAGLSPMRADPEHDPDGKRARMEKWIVRKAFEDILPEEVAWRQKEQFSDGVGYSWIDSLKAITSERVTDAQMANAAERFPVNTPMNKEEYYYRTIFEEHFPSNTAARTVPHEASVACSTAIALEWDAAWKNMNDPSGRAVGGVHEQAYK